MASFDTSMEDLRDVYRVFDRQMSAILRVSGATNADDVVDALLTACCGSRAPSFSGTRTGVSCCGCFPRGWTSILRRSRPCGAKRGIRMIELDLDDFRDDGRVIRSNKCLNNAPDPGVEPTQYFLNDCRAVIEACPDGTIGAACLTLKAIEAGCKHSKVFRGIVIVVVSVASVAFVLLVLALAIARD